MPTSTVRNKTLAVVIAITFAATLLSLALPTIALNTSFADMVVRITDTASWTQLPVLGAVAVVVVVSRPSLSRHRRATEALAITVTLLVILVGNGLLNEHIVKPWLGVARPNIVEQADSGALGAEFPDADSLYAAGNKEERRVILGEKLTAAQTPYLSTTVRAHWIHETGYSFPSGHSTAAMTFAATLAAIGSTWLGGWRRFTMTVIVPIWALAVVYSRVLLEVHRPIDVIAGTTIGFAWGLLAFSIIRTLSDRWATPPQ